MKLGKTHTQIEQYVHEIVKKEHPETVEHLIRLVQQEYSLSEEEIVDIVYCAGLRLTNPQQSRFLDLRHYIVAANARWYWLIISLSMLTASVVLVLPGITPMVYIRYLLGTVFIFLMPGYCLVKSLFPRGKLEKLELIALSLGTSIVLVPMMAFVLHYTPWGITTMSVTTVILILTLALSTIALLREYQNAQTQALVASARSQKTST